MDYKVRIGEKVKTFHANMLKKYYERDQSKDGDDRGEVAGIISVVSACVVDENEDVSRKSFEQGCERVEMSNPMNLGKESAADVNIWTKLSSDQTQQVREVLDEFSDVFADLPGMTILIKHDIKLTTTDPVRVKGYPIPFHMQQTVDEEVQKMLDLKAIEPSVIMVLQEERTVCSHRAYK